MRLHVDGGDPLEVLQRRGRDLLDLDVEHVRHPQVLRPRHALDRADDRRGLGAPQQVAQREPAGQRVGIRIVVQEDEDAVGVGEVPLILLHARARHRAAQLGDERRANQLRQVEVRDVGQRGPLALGRLAVRAPVCSR